MKDFLKKMFSADKDVSSKRVGGLFCIVVCSVLIAFFAFSPKEPSDGEQQLIYYLLIAGVVLLTGASVEKIWTK